MRKNNWLLGGIFLGIIFFLAVFLVKPIGVSTQFSVLSGKIHTAIAADIVAPVPGKPGEYTSTNPYYAKSKGKLIADMKNLANYDYIFVISIPLGAYAAAKALGRKEQLEAIPADANKSQQFALGFLGGAIILYGARLADGCTSGHMMAGISQGSVSGFVFAASVFATAVPTAILVKKYKSGGK